jgi:hypothetical protein
MVGVLSEGGGYVLWRFDRREVNAGTTQFIGIVQDGGNVLRQDLAL